MAKEKDESFDLFIIDAFTSDAIPVHMLTAEAVKMYLAKLKPDGVVLLHTSNRYLDLDSVLGAIHAGAAAGHGRHRGSRRNADGSYGQSTSTVVIFTKSEEALAPYRIDGGRVELDDGGLRAWTDDYSDILGAFFNKFRGRGTRIGWARDDFRKTLPVRSERPHRAFRPPPRRPRRLSSASSMNVAIGVACPSGGMPPMANPVASRTNWASAPPQRFADLIRRHVLVDAVGAGNQQQIRLARLRPAENQRLHDLADLRTRRRRPLPGPCGCSRACAAPRRPALWPAGLLDALGGRFELAHWCASPLTSVRGAVAAPPAAPL